MVTVSIILTWGLDPLLYACVRAGKPIRASLRKKVCQWKE
jgi:hypothetical protein